jgi:hypothetical protein
MPGSGVIVPVTAGVETRITIADDQGKAVPHATVTVVPASETPRIERVPIAASVVKARRISGAEKLPLRRARAATVRARLPKPSPSSNDTYWAEPSRVGAIQIHQSIPSSIDLR